MLLLWLLGLFGLGVDWPTWPTGDPKLTVILAMTLPMVIAYVMVRTYYWRRDARRGESVQSVVQNAESVK